MDLIVQLGEREEKLSIERADGGYLVRLGDREHRIDVVSVGASLNGGGTVRSLIVDGSQYEVSVRGGRGATYEVESAAGRSLVDVLDPLTYLARQSESKAGSRQEQVTAYMPGRVVTLLVAEGDTVETGQGLIVLEAMKMENEIAAEHDAVVRRILVEQGQAVEGGDILIELEQP